MTTQLIQQLQETHLAVWNEKDRAKRDGLITTIYADNIRMYDKDFTLTGNAAISDFIDKVQTDPAFDFTADKPMEFTQNGVRLFWHIKTSQGMLTGMDFFVLENEKVVHLYVFMNAIG